VKPRVVFDTATVVSALLFSGGRLAWLRGHWREGECVPLISHATAAELVRVLGYPRFRLPPADRQELLADYFPFCEAVRITGKCPVACRDSNDQMFLDLAQSGKADLLVSGDKDLLSLAGKTRFLIASPAAYATRVRPPE